MRGWTGWLSLALGVFVVAPAHGRAQDSETRARALFEQGVRASDSGNYELARSSFEQSYQLAPRASTACNMGLVLERTGRLCDASQWYQQCAALDHSGRYRDHATRQASAYRGQCTAAAPNPFVSTPVGSNPSSAHHVEIVESGTPRGGIRTRGADHYFLIPGIGGVLLAGGALAGAIVTANESNAAFDAIQSPPGTSSTPTPLVEGTADADAYQRAEAFRNGSIGLAVTAGLLGAVGLTFLIVDLAQPGAFGGSAGAPSAVRVALRTEAGGATAELRLAF